jgi:hypothetical protein
VCQDLCVFARLCFWDEVQGKGVPSPAPRCRSIPRCHCATLSRAGIRFGPKNREVVQGFTPVMDGHGPFLRRLPQREKQQLQCRLFLGKAAAALARLGSAVSRTLSSSLMAQSRDHSARGTAYNGGKIDPQVRDELKNLPVGGALVQVQEAENRRCWCGSQTVGGAPDENLFTHCE